jgi:hypothetical protein
MSKPKREDIESIIERWIKGEIIAELVEEYGYSMSTVYKQIRECPILAESHACARAIKAETIVDEILKIADEEPDVNRARLKTDLRKWTASKFNASMYGDKLDVNINQTVDIGAALLEARSRSVTQVVDIPRLDTGSEPVAQIGPNENPSDDDIFS